MKPYYDDGVGIQIFHGDCYEILNALYLYGLPAFQCVTDPPYGIDFTQRTTGAKIYGDQDKFDPSPFLLTAETCLFWGCENFAQKLPRGRWLVWLKRAVEIAAPKSYGDCEFAWLSEPGCSKVLRHISDGCIREGAEHGIVRLHPSQKPIAVMKWCFQFVRAGLVVDPFMGSGTTLRAAKDLGRRAIGIEIEERFCEIAAKRLSQEVLDFSEASA